MKEDKNLYLLGGISGIIGTTCYSLAIALPMNLVGLTSNYPWSGNHHIKRCRISLASQYKGFV
jgi:hypothetical protein